MSWKPISGHALWVSVSLTCRGLSPWRANELFILEPFGSAQGRLWENRSVPTGSFQEAEEATREYGVSVVGLTHSRGVGRVMPVESRYLGTLEGVGSLTQRDEVCHAIH